MPPKAKFTRTQIVDAALDIVRECGIEGLTARSLGKHLGSSSCPIFTVFSGMEEVYGETVKAAKAVYGQYISRGLAQDIPFKGVGMQYILFAKNEPRLFQLLFMSEKTVDGVGNLIPAIDDNYALILQSVRDLYALDYASAKRLYLHMCIYTHGIAAFCAQNVCIFTEEEIGGLITEVCMSILKQMKSGECK